jgi:rhodanese-related sulfurtransferase
VPFHKLDELARSYLGLPGRQILVYSDASDGHSAIAGARRLVDLGYTDTYACDGGFDQWRHEGAPIASTPERFRLNFV